MATSMAARFCPFSRFSSGHDRSGAAGHVAWRDAVEREDERILAADVAAAETRESASAARRRPHDVIFRDVSDHSTASEGATTAPVKVEPVVPVRRTEWYSPAAVGRELEQNEVIAPGATEHEPTAARGALHQHLVELADPRDVLAAGVGAHRLDEPLQPVRGDSRRAT